MKARRGFQLVTMPEFRMHRMVRTHPMVGVALLLIENVAMAADKHSNITWVLWFVCFLYAAQAIHFLLSFKLETME